MNEIRNLLCDRFYMPLPVAETGQENKNCHRQRIERPGKPERNLVLRIVDTQNLIAVGRSTNSLICGFHPASKMANELVHNGPNRHPLPAKGTGVNACFDLL